MIKYHLQETYTSFSLQKIAATYDGDLDFLEEDFCIRVLCEHEQGWHTTDETFPVFGLNTRDKQVLLQLVAPYLGRIFALLSHSGVSVRTFLRFLHQKLDRFLLKVQK